MSLAELLVEPDTKPPTIELLGASLVRLEQLSSYLEAGILITDDVDSDIADYERTIHLVR